jgi:hypothetical protein
MAMATTEATIGRALMRLRRVGIDDQGEHLLWPGRFEQLCREGGHRWRQRLFTPWTTLRLFLLQVLNGNVAINALRQLSGLSFAAGSYCEARTRLPLAALQRLLAELCDAALHQLADDDRRDGGRDGGRDGAGEGGRIYAVDSTGCSLPDTPALRRRFGLPAPARVGVSYPMAMVLGLLDLASGLFVRAAAFHLFVHDQRGVLAVHQALRDGDILVGDRAFCSFVHLALLAARGVSCCFRLHQSRLVPRRLRRPAGLVRWSKPRHRPVWMSHRQFAALLPRELTVRIVRHRIRRKGYRTRVVLLAASLRLLDEVAWSDRQIAELYRQRWQVETCFAHLKTTMKMDVLKCRSADGVLRELAVYLIVYNLVRLVMLRWARTCGAGVWRVSFIDAVRLLCVRALGLSGVPRLILNPDRTARRQLRVRRRRPKHFPLLTQPRRQQPGINYYRRRR